MEKYILTSNSNFGEDGDGSEVKVIVRLSQGDIDKLRDLSKAQFGAAIKLNDKNVRLTQDLWLDVSAFRESELLDNFYDKLFDDAGEYTLVDLVTYDELKANASIGDALEVYYEVRSVIMCSDSVLFKGVESFSGKEHIFELCDINEILQ